MFWIGLMLGASLGVVIMGLIIGGKDEKDNNN